MSQNDLAARLKAKGYAPVPTPAFPVPRFSLEEDQLMIDEHRATLEQAITVLDTLPVRPYSLNDIGRVMARCYIRQLLRGDIEAPAEVDPADLAYYANMRKLFMPEPAGDA